MDYMDYMDYPLVNYHIAIENGPVEMVDLLSYKMVDLSIVFCLFTRGTTCEAH